MASCLDKKSSTTSAPGTVSESLSNYSIKEPAISGQENTLGSVSQNKVPTPNEVLNQLSLTYESSQLNSDTIKKNQLITVEKNDSSTNSNISSVGKRIYYFDNDSVGPSLEERKGNYISNYSIDTLRLYTGKYWAIEEKEIKFLKNVTNKPFDIVDYNYTGKGIINISSITSQNGYTKDMSVGSCDDNEVMKNIKNNSGIFSTYATQQWVLIKANTPIYVESIGGKNKDLVSGMLSNVQSHLNSMAGGSVGNSLENMTVTSKASDPEVSLKIWNDMVQGQIAEVQNSATISKNIEQYNNLSPQAQVNLQQRVTIPKTPSSVAGSVTEQLVEYVPTVVAKPNPTYTPIVTPPVVRVFKPAIEIGKDFYDVSFNMDVPLSKIEIENMNSIVSPVYYDISSEYNFLVEKYENILPILPEVLIPNIYSVITVFEEERKDKLLIDQLTMMNSIPQKEFSFKVTSKNLENAKGKMSSVSKIVGDYFDIFARTYEKIVTKESNSNIEQNMKLEKINSLNILSGRFENIGFSIENMNLLKEHDMKRNMFPMYSKIEFNTDRITEFSQILKDSKFSSLLNKRIMRANIEGDGYVQKKYLENREKLTIRKNDYGTYNLNKVNEIQKNNRRVWNISGWLKDIDKMDSEGTITSDLKSDIGIFFGQMSEDEASTVPALKFVRQMMKIIFVGKIRTMIKNHFRKFEDLMNGKLAFSETVLYRMEKWLASENHEPIGNKPLQNIYLPNSNDLEIMRYIDTQVKYGQNYVYKVYAYQVVIGTKYNYSNLMTQGTYAAFLVNQYPEIFLVETPYFSTGCSIIDSPPVFPQVDIVSYYNDNNSVVFLFNSNSGDYNLQPIIINEEDEKQANKYRKTYNLKSDDPIRFKTDDFSSIFQIYRTTTPPSSYKDFQGKLLASIYTDISKGTEQKASSASFIDNIKTNVKYYYTFRTIDFHGHISNPTEIFVVEMVENSGICFLTLETYDMKKKMYGEKNKSFRKHLMISPVFSQTLVNEKKSNLEDKKSVKDVKNIFLGVADETIWGKKFKIRLISKKTGKKIDLNVYFETKDVRTETKEE